MTGRPNRQLVARMAGFASRERVYLVEGALEVDDVDQFEITRRRLFFDEIELVTYHRRFGIGALIFTAFVGFAFALPGVLLAVTGTGIAAAVLLLLASPFLAAFVLGLWLKVDVITVHGKTRKVEIRFSYLKARCRRLFVTICERTRTTQARIAAEVAREEREVAARELPPDVSPPPFPEEPPPPIQP